MGVNDHGIGSGGLRDRSVRICVGFCEPEMVESERRHFDVLGELGPDCVEIFDPRPGFGILPWLGGIEELHHQLAGASGVGSVGLFSGIVHEVERERSHRERPAGSGKPGYRKDYG